MPNRLAFCTSPYLKQHAENPVDWYPWGDEAFTRAKLEDKPILLSIGYASCHWCHVMEQESFEDPEIANLMNQNFICIKVDREERPDIDALYMTAVQALTGSGGWPLTVFLTPDGKPFFGGTYFPREERYGIPSFPRVLLTIASLWKNQRQALMNQADELIKIIKLQENLTTHPEMISHSMLYEALVRLEGEYDTENGGFGQAPKFPQPLHLEFLLRMATHGYSNAANMVMYTLNKMTKAGIYDCVDGGFHRYATDSAWMVPHFEKMLYDNAQLACEYLQTWKITRNPFFLDVCKDTLEFIISKLMSKFGFFYSSIDADADGKEGYYYTFDRDEISSVLDKLGNKAKNFLNIPDIPNFEDDRFILSLKDSLDRLNNPEFLEVRRFLKGLRSNHPTPSIDNKLVVSWNALAISSFSLYGAATGETEYVGCASKCARFILDNLLQSDGTLFHSWCEKQKGSYGFLEDYALLGLALIDLYTASFEKAWLTSALYLTKNIVERFYDPEEKCLFYAQADFDKNVPVRPRNVNDSPIPSGLGAAAMLLIKISRIFGIPEYERIAGEVLRQYAPVVKKYPSAFPSILQACDLYLSIPSEIILIASPNDDMLRAMQATVNKYYVPNSILITEDLSESATIVFPAVQGKTRINDSTTAYVCESGACKSPVCTIPELEDQIRRITILI
jgi:uncharacterized protein YyaL (SSP411 family)